MTSASSVHDTGDPKLVLCDNPEGEGGEGVRVQDGGAHVYLRSIHVDMAKPSKYCHFSPIKIN